MKQKLGRKLLRFLLTLAMVVGLMPGMGLTAEAATIQYDDYLVEVTNHSQNFIAAGICDQTTGLKCKTLSVETARALENYLKSKTGSKVAVIYGCTIRSNPGWSRISFVIDGTTDDSYYMDVSIADAIRNRGARNEAEYKLFYVKTDAPDFETANETVTFKVINGQWDDGTTEDVTVSLSGLKDEIRLAADQIPAVGTKPNDTYKAGSWDVTPSADTAITAATTYTYTYAAKEASVVTEAPTAKTLTYTGSAQALVTAGTATGGEMQYALGNATEATQPYTTSIPAKTEAGTYYVWYKVVGDSDHSDSEPACVTATISEKPKETDQTTPATIQLNSNFFVRWKGNNVLVNWGTVPSADSYEVWATYCGTSSFELVTTVQGGNKAKITKLKGKSLNKKRGVKAYVVAKQGGTSLGRTLYGHSASPKHSRTNAKKVTVKKNSYSLSVGQTAKIKASTVKAKSSKKLLHNGYYRYASSNPSVATVSSDGRITAVGAGTCDVWVYALNGKSKKIGVTVK